MKKAIRPAIFKWRQTAPELIVCAVRWYLRYSLSLRDVEELLDERGLKADHTTVWRWVSALRTGTRAEGPIGGMLRYDLLHIGEAVVGASPPVRDAIFPVRRQEGGITTGVALHNLESSPGLVRCDLMREGVLRDFASIPLEANGQTSWLIDQAFPRRRYVRLHGVGALRCGWAGAVQRRGPGNGLRHPHLHHPAGVSGSAPLRRAGKFGIT